MSKKRLNSYVLLEIIGVILIAISILYATYAHLRIENRKENILDAKDEFISAPKIENEKIENADLNLEVIEKDEKPVLKEEAIAYIEIPSLELVLPIFNSTSKEALYFGTGLLDQTDYPSSLTNTTAVIAGHRGGYNGEQTFRYIDQLGEGDEIIITTKTEVLTYVFSSKLIIEKNDWSHFTREEDKTKLILLTCHPYPQNYQRLIVQCELIENKNIN